MKIEAALEKLELIADGAVADKYKVREEDISAIKVLCNYSLNALKTETVRCIECEYKDKISCSALHNVPNSGEKPCTKKDMDFCSQGKRKKRKVQEVLIGQTIELCLGKGSFMNVLKMVYGEHSYEYWMDNYSYTFDELRTDKKLLNYFKVNGFALPQNEEDNHHHFIEKVKIVEIPADVKWKVKNYECSVGEYIEENHREWS